MRSLTTLLANSFLFTLTLLGGDFSGTWVGQIPVHNGEMQDIAFKFTQNGTALEGKLYGDYGSTPIVEGKIAGDLVIFLVITQEQAGNQINDTRIRFSGRMINGEIELTRDRERATIAGNGGDVQFRNNAKQTFRLKRLL